MPTFQPLRDYAGFNHVLMAGGVWAHPGNGNMYACACEQIAGVQQDLAVYRLPAGGIAWEEIKRYRGTVDSAAQITWGSAAIGMGGAMFVVTSLVIPNAPKVTNTGFQGCWIREPNIDSPWSLGASVDPARIAALEHASAAQAQQIVDIGVALGNLVGGELSAADADVIAWARALRNVIGMA